MKTKRTIIKRDLFGAVAQVEFLPDSIVDYLRSLPNLPKADDLEALDAWRANIDAQLQLLGWPPLDARITVRPDKSWHVTVDRTADLAGGNVRIPLGRTFIENHATPLSAAWFLVRMADRLMHLRDGLQRQDAHSVLRDALALGADNRELEIRHVGLRSAEVGDRQLKASERGAEVRSAGSFKATKGAEAQALAERLLADQPGWLWVDVLRKIAKHYDVSFETVRKALKRPTGPKKIR